MVQKRRLSVVVSADLEQRLYDLRKTDKYCKLSISELVRIYIAKGLAADKHASPSGPTTDISATPDRPA